MVTYGCDRENDHVSHMSDCRLDETTAAIRAFVLGR
jgi:hypothetical protein